MNRVTKHVVFAGLILVYVLVVLLAGMKFRFFTSRFQGGLGMDLYLISAWCACYWRGPLTRGALHPYPFRSAAIFFGVVGMIGSLGLKIATELGR